MTEWILVLALNTSASSQTHVVPGFSTKDLCEKGGDDLTKAVLRAQVEASTGGFKLLGANFSCTSVEK